MNKEQLKNLKIEDLEEVTEVQAFEKAREMLVWNDDCKPEKAPVLAIIKWGERTAAFIDRGSNGVLYGKCAEIPTPKMRDMNSLEVMEYLHLLQLNLSTGIIRVGNHPANITYANHGHGLIVTLNTMSHSVGWKNYTLFSKVDNIKTTKFGVLKNGKVTEFELPQIQIENK